MYLFEERLLAPPPPLSFRPKRFYKFSHFINTGVNALKPPTIEKILCAGGTSWRMTLVNRLSVFLFNLIVMARVAYVNIGIFLVVGGNFIRYRYWRKYKGIHQKCSAKVRGRLRSTRIFRNPTWLIRWLIENEQLKLLFFYIFHSVVDSVAFSVCYRSVVFVASNSTPHPVPELLNPAS